MSSCFGSRKKQNGDTQPLLPQYNDDTTLQRAAHQKLHTYQMLRALGKGFMPSTEQAIVNLRTLLASDVLNPETPGLSHNGRVLVKLLKQFLTEFIELLRNKNDADQIQDFIWYMLQARINIDTEDIARKASSSRTKADAAAAFESIRTVGSLLLTNKDFRVFLSDLSTIGKQVFSDTAHTLSNVAEEAANKVEPSAEESNGLKKPGDEQAPSKEQLNAEASEIGDVIADGLKKTGKEAVHSAQENLQGDQKETLLYRLKNTVANLRKRTDYSDSVSTIGLLIERYAKAYSRAADKTISAAQDDVNTNAELDRAVKNGWLLLSSFGDKDAWKELEKRFNKVMDHSKKDPEFENLMTDVAASIQKMLTDPDFYDNMGNKVDELSEKTKEVGTDSPLKRDVDTLLQQSRITLDSVLQDTDVNKLLKTSSRLWAILSPANTNSMYELLSDSYTVFIPMLISAIQYIPIPRLEISVPEIDLLLENLILEPGKTINNTSFLPYKLKLETYNDVSIHKARFGTVSSASSFVTIKIQGLSLRADEVGFWLRAHSGPLSFADEGIASFAVDERGIDLAIDVEIGKERLESILTLRDVKVKIHKLNYSLSKSKFACLAWLLKPFLRPVIKRVLEQQISTAIGDALHAANRELLYARERLRATRISDPQDVRTFIKAVMTRLTPKDNPDLYASVGVTGGARERGNVFSGVYAPGSIVKVWEEEGQFAGERVEDAAVGTGQGWRNEIFDVQSGNLFS